MIVLIVLAFLGIKWYLDKLEKKEGTVVVSKKECPPHQWYWENLVDQDGEHQGERMVCKKCGPLSKLLGHGEV